MSPVRELLFAIPALCLYAIGGVLIRDLLTFDLPNGGCSSFYPNLLGCFLLGILAPNKKALKERAPLFINGFGTGFCGSLTTFSGFVWCLATNSTFEVLILDLFMQMSTYYLSFYLGTKIGSFFKVASPPIQWVPRKPSLVEPLWYCAHIITLLAAVLALITIHRHSSSYQTTADAALFGILGCLARASLALFNTNAWKWGTMAANLIAAAVYQWCSTSVRIGLLGALSTMSTFVGEGFADWGNEFTRILYQVLSLASGVAIAFLTQKID